MGCWDWKGWSPWWACTNSAGGTNRIIADFGCSRDTVKRDVSDGWMGALGQSGSCGRARRSGESAEGAVIPAPADAYTTRRLEAACRRAMDFATPSYQSVKNILVHELDRLPQQQPAEPEDGPLQLRFARC